VAAHHITTHHNTSHHNTSHHNTSHHITTKLASSWLLTRDLVDGLGAIGVGNVQRVRGVVHLHGEDKQKEENKDIVGHVAQNVKLEI
jgi:hypothetical protein